MAVQTDLQMAMAEYDSQIRKDVSKWQQCIARTGDKKAAESLRKPLSGNDEGLRRWFDGMELNARLTVPPTYTYVDENGNVQTCQNL